MDGLTYASFAAAGILTRVSRRGRSLPLALMAALRSKQAAARCSQEVLGLDEVPAEYAPLTLEVPA